MCKLRVRSARENGNLAIPPQQRVDEVERRNVCPFHEVCRTCGIERISSGDARVSSVGLEREHCILFACYSLPRLQCRVGHPTMDLGQANHCGSAVLEVIVLFGDAT